MLGVTTISTTATQARETARRSDGRFGEQPHPDAGQLDLATPDDGPVIGTIYSELDTAERAEAMKADLHAAIGEAIETGQLGDWLAKMVNPHMARWSFGNRALATLQTHARRAQLSAQELAEVPQEPMVMTAKRWKEEYGRWPKKGSKAIWIRAPRKAWVEVDDPDHPGQTKKELRMVGTRPQAEFDVSQTEGRPIPDVDTEYMLDHDLDADVMPFLHQRMGELGYVYREAKLEEKLTIATTGGYSRREHAWSREDGRTDTKVIEVDSRLPAAHKAMVLLHEMGHMECGHLDDGHGYSGAVRARKETEAQVTAFLAARELGIVTDDRPDSFSATYIASWSNGQPEIVDKAFSNATKAYAKIMDGFRTHTTGASDAA